MRNPVFAGVAVAGVLSAGVFVSTPASAGCRCDPRRTATIIVVPRPHGHWHHRQPFYGEPFYRQRVLAWQSWGPPPRWGWRSDWRWRGQWHDDWRWRRGWRGDWGWRRW